jgi:hypothetical protein
VDELGLRPDDLLPGDHPPERRSHRQAAPKLLAEQLGRQTVEISHITGPAIARVAPHLTRRRGWAVDP